jgi:hypothetical protein
MTNDTSEGSSQPAPQDSYGDGTGESGTPQDAPFPLLDFPGAEGLQGAPRRRLTPVPLGTEADRAGALGTYDSAIIGPFFVVIQCVEQSELFPAVCNRWEVVYVGAAPSIEVA